MRPLKSFSVLTVSDSCAAGLREDGSGPGIIGVMTGEGYTLVESIVVPDGMDSVASALMKLCGGASLVLTTGGTGLSPRDFTPEATMEVCERLVPGVSEMLRARSAEKVGSAWLGRGCAGIREGSLVVNLPGSVKAVRECLEFLIPLLPHALEVLSGDVGRCGG
ncbi:MAG: MogA/MoaB family molybdenum cofactor biosynthesis protein [Candidatus Fermentibacteraceae bacterium]